jgi:putative FmdB family regulatory protein
MPLYDYKCPKCGKEFEDTAPIISRDTIKCDCGELAIRLITGGSFLLKGEGWSKQGHVKVIPPTTDPSLSHDWKTNYYNCTPESVHKT